jgi:hypothetical protein
MNTHPQLVKAGLVSALAISLHLAGTRSAGFDPVAWHRHSYNDSLFRFLGAVAAAQDCQAALPRSSCLWDMVDIRDRGSLACDKWTF